ncbi:MAG: tRNA (adenosine(37)-N6)-threonylcarbamoyltransferase complex ATPase subunit type 1 TsaE [Candidatus Yanofskybacteria bacterium RIFCSPLOWO2_02_FULL_43_10]|uniref:tRNA threonylcarbamoyladenosine biosynthesis protein TsaE n=1 Tax=Candidatus Yanofskybacteria bacterium RIFCSPLOWO2_12_FULL_43_11b TaxID=1802710 RepID=A0A1F8H9I5_9BACT|nr:MAG: tRNA (adenosine(37)-N6)-threonylcarbamoyltransferase complex ATPase subunit type 1 TsaE [Candidatus Yanofskybacteria bacterium RIFCSPHIGHO2_01_FULL_43_32]OGN11097.1 MAG: tRNA (adenosine(37)-N6)-threonylcarbamoyltransferase complex ATPase subunit type 1 TsaE [Candidatus Yanofskybacteria bacterium RIFCSPHIGHO2_02_FULL_43_12]OGN17240.1 MAG: tRNA (adenosine(37)-N6)-threonylcarbamoyltransferase complex ATPase subunit type 1 TsaE [Candidatus Yanofskybacteria bacterium RIFCSPHIGHO2_12_FULL_43_11
MEFISKNVKETQKIAADLARKIIKTKNGTVVALEGELGAGKTVFVKGFVKTLGIKSKIKSPTFVLMKKYKVPHGNYLYHLDCYRIRDHKDLKIPEFKEIIHEPHNIVLIEWAERVKAIIPKKHITVHIDHISRNKRKIQISKSNRVPFPPTRLPKGSPRGRRESHSEQ